jgi:hypothetical protein
MGCPGDWLADCDELDLTFDPADGTWRGIFEVPAGNWEWKVPVNDSWSENYGRDGARDGANLALTVETPGPYEFVFNQETKVPSASPVAP